MERDGCSLKRTRDRPARVCALIMAVRFEKQDAIGYVILDRPPANSYDRAFMEELDAAIESARSDDAVRSIVVRSASEKFFSAGADVSVFAKSDLDTQNASGPSPARGQIKLATVQGFGTSLAEGLATERAALIRLFGSEDAREGVKAFVEKRKPEYQGR